MISRASCVAWPLDFRSGDESLPPDRVAINKMVKQSNVEGLVILTGVNSKYQKLLALGINRDTLSKNFLGLICSNEVNL